MATAANAANIVKLQNCEPSASLARFSWPRYWAAWMLVAWFRFTASLSWPFALRVHTHIGRVLWLLMRRHRRMVERNVRQCFPSLGPPPVRRLVLQHFENLGVCLAETAFAWFGKVDESLAPFRIEGEEHIHAALAAGRGVVLYTGHFTAFEICAPILKQRFPLFGFMFHRRRNALLHEIQRRGRRFSGHLSFPSDDVRSMLRALKENAVVWYAPDQHFSSRSSTVLPFFGAQSNVSTATCRLARASGAAIVPFSYRRLPGDAGYVMSFEPAIEFDPKDEIAGTRKLVEVLERFIRECPEQYIWTRHFIKRFRAQRHIFTDGETRQRRQPTIPDASPGLFEATKLTLFTIVGVALFITSFDNTAFFGSVFSGTKGSEHQLGIMLSMFMLIFTTLTIILSLVPCRRGFKVAAAALLVVAAIVGYFASYYGIVIDASMIRNVMETDVREASPLFTTQFLVHVAVLGLVPAGAIFMLPLGGSGWRREVSVRAIIIVASIFFLGVTLYANLRPVAYFGQQHHAVRMQINPLYPLYALYRYGTRASESAPPVPEPLDAHRVTGAVDGRKPVLFVFVMGETARADRYSFNGYERDTNPYTRAHDVINFSHVTSCGTSTADSVPCIFSRFGHDEFTHAKFARNETLLRTLGRLDIDVKWRDNSTGCKRICDEASFESLAGAQNAGFCHDNVCVDEILLEDLGEVVEDDSKDHFIVLHQRGSHGPAYYLDSPQFAKAWLPECDSASLQNCDRQMIDNAYDNTIIYTDYFLSRSIDRLEGLSGRYQTALLYLSDHGESLGEKGLYLHGMPYSLAPEEQTHVPMLFWASDEFFADHSIDKACLRRSADSPINHDYVFHSILPLFDIASPAYEPRFDIFARCRTMRVAERSLLSARSNGQRALN